MLIFSKLNNITKLFCTSGNSADFCCKNGITRLYNIKQFLQLCPVGFHTAFVFKIYCGIGCPLLFQLSDLSVNVLHFFIGGTSCISVNHRKHLTKYDVVYIIRYKRKEVNCFFYKNSRNFLRLRLFLWCLKL